MISVFGGTGFLGTAFRKHSRDITVTVPRDSAYPASRDILYLISTTDNYNIYGNVFLDVETNLMHLLRVLRALKSGDTFNFVSSWFVYGGCPLPATEEAHCDPQGFYSITKRAAEQLLISYCLTYGINYRIFRLANLYGPGDKGCSSKKNAMQWLVGKVCRGEDVQLYHGGNSVRDYLHVSDAAKALDLCLREAPKNGITNVGSGKRYKLSSIISYAKQLTGSRSQIISVSPTEFHKQVQVKDFYMDVSKLCALGFRRKVTIKAGIQELIRDLR